MEQNGKQQLADFILRKFVYAYVLPIRWMYSCPLYLLVPERLRVLNPVVFFFCRQNLEALIGWGTISVTYVATQVSTQAAWSSG